MKSNRDHANPASRLLLVIASFLYITAVAHADNHSPIHCNTPEYDFGIVDMADGDVIHSFELTNQTTEPLTVRGTHASCGCTSVVLSSAVMDAGTSIIARMRVTAKAPGFTSEDAYIVLDRLQYRLSMQGVFIASAKLAPEELFVSIADGEQPAVRFDVLEYALASQVHNLTLSQTTSGSLYQLLTTGDRSDTADPYVTSVVLCRQPYAVRPVRPLRPEDSGMKILKFELGRWKGGDLVSTQPLQLTVRTSVVPKIICTPVTLVAPATGEKRVAVPFTLSSETVNLDEMDIRCRPGEVELDKVSRSLVRGVYRFERSGSQQTSAPVRGSLEVAAREGGAVALKVPILVLGGIP